MAGFLSCTVNKIDRKDRLSVPAHIRVALGLMRPDASVSTNPFICFPSLAGPWLQAVTPQQMQQFMGMQDPLAPFAGEIDALGIAFYAQAAELTPDTDGRITLPAHLRAYANIDTEVMFVGQGSSFSMWNPDTFAEYSAQLRDQAREQFSDLAARQVPPQPTEPVPQDAQNG